MVFFSTMLSLNNKFYQYGNLKYFVLLLYEKKNVYMSFGYSVDLYPQGIRRIWIIYILKWINGIIHI